MAFRDMRESEVSRLLGTVFTDSLQGLEPGQWSGPVRSGFGLHLVFIEDRTAGGKPELPEVRAAVEREWLGQRRQQTVDGLYERLAENYTVEIEPMMDPENEERADP